MSTADMFAGIDKVEVSGHSNDYVDYGHYYLRLDGAHTGKNTQTTIPNAVMNFTVVHVVDGNFGKCDEISKGKGNHSFGQEVDYVMSRKNLGFLKEVKIIIANLLGVNIDEVTAEMCGVAFPENGLDSPLCGQIVESRGTEKKRTKNYTAEKPTFTQVNFKRIVPAAELAQVLPQASKDRFFPAGQLDRMVAEEAGQAPAPAAPAPLTPAQTVDLAFGGGAAPAPAPEVDGVPW